MTFEFIGQIFEKYSDIKSHEHPSSWSRVVPCGLTNRQTWRSIRIFAILLTRLNVSTIKCNHRRSPRAIPGRSVWDL